MVIRGMVCYCYTNIIHENQRRNVGTPSDFLDLLGTPHDLHDHWVPWAGKEFRSGDQAEGQAPTLRMGLCDHPSGSIWRFASAKMGQKFGNYMDGHHNM